MTKGALDISDAWEMENGTLDPPFLQASTDGWRSDAVWTTIQQKVLIHKICNVSGILYLALEKLKPPLMDANRAKEIL